MSTRYTAFTAAMLVAAAAFAQATPAPAAKPAAQPAQQEAAPTLPIADKAPARPVERWEKGNPFTGFGRARAYVVEFWATWCGPCVASMPHLTELQHEYKDKGVTIIGMTSTDVNGNTLEKVEKMVKDKGDEKMGYTVAWDTNRKTNDAFMKASG